MLGHPIRKFLRSRRGAVAMAIALMIVPILICAGAAVDFSRISAARTELQAAVDNAAIAGAGEWQNTESPGWANTVAVATYGGTGSALNSITANSGNNTVTTVSLYCSAAASAVQCERTDFPTPPPTASYSSVQNFPSGCATAPEYCVIVTSKVLMANSLFAFVLPNEYLSATAAASVAFASGNKGLPSPPANRFGTAGDISGIYAYAVPLSGGKPEFNQLPNPNSFCSTSPGPIQFETTSTPTSGTTQCNYLFIADSLGDGGNGGTITSNASNPIAFAFINYTGKNEGEQWDATRYTTNLMVSTTYTATNSGGVTSYTPNGFTYYPNGYVIPGTSTTCERHQPNCTPGITAPTQLYGYCPAHNLYGSMYSSDGSNSMGTPAADSINTLSSAYEMLGYAPTYQTNHALTPFVATPSFASTTSNNAVVPFSSGGLYYFVEAVCPNWPIPTGSTINAPVSNNYVSASNPNAAGTNIFSTWYPTGLPNELAYNDGMNTTSQPLTNGNGVYPNDVYPPGITACMGATNALDAGVTPSSIASWWGWSDNTTTASNSLANTSNCGSQPAATTESYSNCALIIQDLGTDVPQISVDGVSEAALPDYYNIITSDPAGKTVVAFDPVYDGTTYVDVLTGATIANTAGTGTYPTNTVLGAPTGMTFTGTSASGVQIGQYTTIPYGYTSATSGVPAHPFNTSAGSAYYGDYLWIQEPARTDAGTYDESLPLLTSFRCYNPQFNGITAGTYSGDNNNGSAIDPIANPQLGAIECDSTPPQNYALYWNDMGGPDTDDLGYWNAIEVFTCSTPPSSNAGGGGSLLSS